MADTRGDGNFSLKPTEKTRVTSGSPQAIYSIQQDARVYICGYDVTNLVSNLSATYQPLHAGGNICTIVLQNPNNVFTITEDNIQGKFYSSRGSTENTPVRVTDFTVDEFVKQQIYQKKSNPAFSNPTDKTGKTIGELIEIAVENLKNGESKTESIHSVKTKVFEVYRAEKIGDPPAKKWDLAEGTPIFNTNDPVRIYVRHPYRMVTSDASATIEPAWYSFFTGYISQSDLMENLDTGVSVLNISCKGVATRLLELARVVTNPGLMLDVLAGDVLADTAVNELVNPSGFTSTFVNMTFPQFLGVLLAGYDPRLDAQGTNNPIPDNLKKIKGIGRFSYGSWAVPYNDSNKYFLDFWTTEVCHPAYTESEVRRIGLTSGFGKPEDANVAKAWGGFNGENAPDTGKIHFLIPDANTFDLYTSLIDYNVWNVDNIAQSEFDSRLELLKKYAHAYMQYEVWESPKGDIVAEFPMYDFLPEDFKDYGEKQLIHGSSSVSMSFAENDSHVYTWLTCKASLTPMQQATIDEGGMLVACTGTAILADLIPRYGIRTFEVPCPFIRFEVGSDSAEKALMYFMRVAASKIVAELRSARTSIGYLDPALVVNRPYLVKSRNLLGYIVRITQNLNYQGTATTDLDLNYIRNVTIDPAGNRRFMFINASEASKPLNFKKLLGGPGEASPQETGGTVQTTPETSSAPGTPSQGVSEGTNYNKWQAKIDTSKIKTEIVDIKKGISADTTLSDQQKARLNKRATNKGMTLPSA